MKTLVMVKKIGIALFSTLLSVSAYAGIPTVCVEDGISLVVLPDCTTITINTCYKGVPKSATSNNLDVDIVSDTDASAGDSYCGQPANDTTGCVFSGDLAEDVRVDTIQKRNNATGNATPAKNGKGTAEADCDDCPGRMVNIDVTMTNKKNAHFDLLLEKSENTFVCKVGFNAHSQIEEV